MLKESLNLQIKPSDETTGESPKKVDPALVRLRRVRRGDGLKDFLRVRQSLSRL